MTLVSARSLAIVLTIAPLLAGCSGAQLPDCVSEGSSPATGLPGSATQDVNNASPPGGSVAPPVAAADAKELLIGIDGSGSMLGHARASDSSRWLNLLQSINLSTQTQGLTAKAYRIGAGKAQELNSESVTAARNPCFFQGCAPYPAVASSLQTLWDVKAAAGFTPLRLLVSDLEVNQNDISTLIGAIRKDLSKGAAAGVLALKLPFEGQVFNASGKPIFTGKLERPVYLLATGNASQVRGVLGEIRKNMALKGVNSQQLSILDPQAETKTLTIGAATLLPQTIGRSGEPLRLEGNTYNPSTHPLYRFAKLREGSTGMALATVQPWSGGVTRPDLGLVKLERIPLAPSDSTDLGGIRLKSMSVAGSNLRLELEIPPSTPAGAVRATVPRGNLPDQWWIEWDKEDPKAATAKEKTEGLLLLMTTLSQQVQARSPSKAPAAALCIAFQHI
jgi:hypothetical protein